MKLISSTASPFVRKVRVLIHEAGIEGIEETTIATTPMQSDPVAISANPTGKIPALLRADGPAIYDSRVICRYLDDKAGAGLYPESRIWEVLTLEATADAVMDAAVLMTYEARFKSTEGVSGEWIEAQWGKVDRALSAIEARWMSHLEGPLTAAQIAVGCALSYIDFRHGTRDWRAARPALKDWHAAFEARPSMQATRPE